MLLTAFGKKSRPGLVALFKTGRMRKLLILFFLALCLLSTTENKAQGISLSVKNATLENVFVLIQQQSPYRFIYTNEKLADSKKVSVSVKNASIEKLLEIIFKDQPIGYKLEGEVIVIYRKDKPSAITNATGLTINGKVINERGEGLPAVTITLKGNANATATDEKGNFILKDVDPSSVLLVSSVGYESKQVSVAGRTIIVVQLIIAVNTLDETIIKGYYNTSKRLNTGSVAKISSADINKQPVNNILGALEGRLPGVYVSQNTGAPGGSFTVQVRGRNSILSGNNPLYIIDGVPFTSTPLGSSISVLTQNGSPLAAFNPSDIESVEVLKDADATAIYGSRGANGIILITTKKGKEGKTKVDVNVSTGFGRNTRKMKLLNTSQFLTMRKEAFKNDGATPVPGLDNDINGTWDTTRYTDWQKELIGGTSKFTNAQLSLSGGNDNTQFLVGGAFGRETTVLPGNFSDQKFSLHFNLTTKSSNQKFKAVISGSYINDNNNLCRTDPTSDALQFAPDAPNIYDSLGKLNWSNLFFNPFGPLLETYNMNTDNLVANGLLTYQVIPGLTIKTSFGYTKIQGKELSTSPLTSMSPLFGNTSGWSYFGNSSSKTWIVEPQLNYQRSLYKGKLDILVGATLQQDSKQASLLRGDGFLDDALLKDISAASTITKQNSVSGNIYDRQYKYAALFARVNYNWQDKYLINLTGRRDGSSRFGPGKQFANFGAAGIAWIFSQEQFIKTHLPFISFGKLRSSFGITGNDQIADYGYLSTYTPTNYSYAGSAGLYPGRLFNPDYAWELNKKLEAALELGFLQDRIFISAAWYQNRSSNQLVGLPLPGITGFTSIQGNLPATVQNKGWEFSINTLNVKSKNLQWNIALNLSIPQNKVISYPGIANSNYAYTYSIGQPLQVQYKYHLTGVSSSKGDYVFEDKDKNGSITFPTDAAFQKKIGTTYYGGLLNTLTYKQWQLDILFQFVKQTAYNYQQYFGMPGLLFNNEPAIVMNRWQKAGDQSSIEKFSQDYGSAAYQAYSDNQSSGDGNITDASYIRLKNLSIYYVLNEKSIKKFHIQSGKIFFQTQNLLTITNYLGLDPETTSGLVLPPLRVLSVGFQLTF